MLTIPSAPVGASGAMRIRLEWLVQASQELDRGLPTDPRERESLELYRRQVARCQLDEAVERIASVRAEARGVVEQALRGELGDTPRERETILLYTHRMSSRDETRRVAASFDDILAYGGSPTRRDKQRLAEVLAVRLRELGELEGAYALFCLTWPRWVQEGKVDERLPATPLPWRLGVPGIWLTEQGLYGHRHVPRPVREVDWSRWDHVVGCGTHIDRRALTRLGVPERMQHVVEVHWRYPLPWSPLPRLKGRVVVVDDVNQGQNSQCLARVYDADVVATEPRAYYGVGLYQASEILHS